MTGEGMKVNRENRVQADQRSRLLPGQPGRARITVRPGRPARGGRGRMPFAVLMVLLLASGLLGLLMLNTALNEGSFELTKLQKQTTTLTDQQQSLQQQIDHAGAPDALERSARQLGMVPGGDPAFLQDDGKVLGSPGPAKDSPPVKRTGVDLWPAAGPAAPAPGAAPAPAGGSADPAAGAEGSLRVDPVSPAPSQSPGASPSATPSPSPSGSPR